MKKFLIALLLASIAGCAANSVVDQINMVCSRVADHVIEPMGEDCTACYAKGQSVIACTAHSKKA